MALAAKLSRSQNPSAAKAFVDELDSADQVRHLLDEDVSAVNRLVDWHANPSRNIDANIEPDELIHVAQDGTINEVHLVVKGPDDFQKRGNVQWLEEGDGSKGLNHILERHGTDDQFYKIKGIESIDYITDSVYDTIRHGEPHKIPDADDGGTAYVYQYSVDKKITAIVADNGYIVTARPGGYP